MSSYKNSLQKSHRDNIRNGLVYASATQSVERLKQKIGDGQCYVAMQEDRLVGTATICLKKIDYWYFSGTVGLIKLVAVDPDKKHAGVGTQCIETCIHYAREVGIKVIVTDSADENMAFKKLVTRLGGKMVDYCKYKANNIVSAVYALFFDRDLEPEDSFREEYLGRKCLNIVEHD